MKNKTSGKYCTQCGYKVRGANHVKGEHHQNGKKKK